MERKKTNEYNKIVGNDVDSGDEKIQDTSDVSERRHSSSDPVNLSLGCREREDDSNDGHIDVETIGNAPSKVCLSQISKNILHDQSFKTIISFSFFRA